MSSKKCLFAAVGYTASHLSEIMGLSRATLYNVLSGKTAPGQRWANGVRSVSRQIELEYEQELAALNERYAKRRAAVAQLIYNESEEDDEEA